jgi:hypothetical protein
MYLIITLHYLKLSLACFCRTADNVDLAVHHAGVRLNIRQCGRGRVRAWLAYQYGSYARIHRLDSDIRNCGDDYESA